MKGLKIKKEFADHQVGFNGSGLPLGIRTDIHILAKTAIESGDQSLLNLFEQLPTAEAIKEYEGELFLADNPGTETPKAEPTSEPKPETPKAVSGKEEKEK